ncbi:bifunctional 4-hydroxy-2-oxoglutarate aldolase/2-dehydro-3-deoxy-phosphogluconate aldolase [Ruania rhizosphaerae]|uniref:bifunctional 4-hydroxy-2-oxoglutarate aldolase/2-dehydro-3-deoxy-phosphogluconate aldolase n=1 Tax=Ruania rhizosphaerae TaxID=1840413 RepID=UPI001356D480|nr:bifunctional 4-hydroxy-2-oxoglutarate aldolase/2-dehydro-3-deoxy-phosphogluconate aldolase [Ruania rhizosphaerae]
MNEAARSRRVEPSPQLVETGVMAILRGTSTERFNDICHVLVDAGITCLEITLSSLGAVDAITSVRSELPSTVDVGAGTVTTADEVRKVLDAGAGFIVSPSVELDVMGAAVDAGVPVYPGALTPTEIIRAWRAGASAVKLFPASAVGPSYLKDVSGPCPDIRLMPTGGIALDCIGDWIRAGALGVGLGGSLQGDAADGGDLAALAERAEKAVGQVRQARRDSE